MKSILIYRDQILPISETFIRAQARAITRYHVRFAGLFPAGPSDALPPDRCLLMESNNRLARLRARIYRRTGVAPLFHRRLAAWKPSLLHAHFATDAADAVLLADHLGIPMVATLHGYDVTIDRPFRQVYSRLWKRASLFLCVSEFIREKALEAGFPEEKLRIHHIGIDCAQFSPDASSVRPSQVLFVGRLVEKKGCAYLIAAMRQVQDVFPQAHLTVIGDGPLRLSLEAQARELQLSCTFLGSQNSEIIRQHIAQAAVFCAPSVTASNGDSEGLGMVFLEAQAMGVPVVSFQHGGVPEAVVHGVTGLLAPERDVAVLAEYILRYLADDELRAETGRQGVAAVRKNFDLQRQTEQLEDIYAEILD